LGLLRLCPVFGFGLLRLVRDSVLLEPTFFRFADKHTGCGNDNRQEDLPKKLFLGSEARR